MTFQRPIFAELFTTTNTKNSYKPDWVNIKEFRVTEDHIKLLQKTIVNWDSSCSGSPMIDPVQPYGTTCVQCDVAKILDIKPRFSHKDKTVEYREDQVEYMEKIHKETQIALQIFLNTGKMEPGLYRDRLWNQWEKVGESGD